jgi:hypothetical protein
MRSTQFTCHGESVAPCLRGVFQFSKEGKIMLNKKRLFVQVALILACVSFAKAQTPTCQYSLASLQGSYAVVGNYGANVAIAFGSRSYDGNGNMSGTFLVNQPKVGSTTGERTITTGTQSGTYTVNCDGTGVITRAIKRADGTTASSVDDFIITAAIRIFNGSTFVPVATTVVDSQTTPNAIVPDGLLTRTHTRLPN